MVIEKILFDDFPFVRHTYLCRYDYNLIPFDDLLLMNMMRISH